MGMDRHNWLAEQVSFGNQIPDNGLLRVGFGWGTLVWVMDPSFGEWACKSSTFHSRDGSVPLAADSGGGKASLSAHELIQDWDRGPDMHPIVVKTTILS